MNESPAYSFNPLCAPLSLPDAGLPFVLQVRRSLRQSAGGRQTPGSDSFSARGKDALRLSVHRSQEMESNASLNCYSDTPKITDVKGMWLIDFRYCQIEYEKNSLELKFWIRYRRILVTLGSDVVGITCSPVSLLVEKVFKTQPHPCPIISFPFFSLVPDILKTPITSHSPFHFSSLI